LKIGVLRPFFPEEDSFVKIYPVLQDFKETVYQRGAPLELLPKKADCVTSIYYIFLEAFGIKIPITYIGDLPRSLVRDKWKFHIVDERGVQLGDMIFVKKIGEKRLISHVALVLDQQSVFHCKKERGAIIEGLFDFFKVYEQSILEEELNYIDVRNVALRILHGGIYLNSKL